MRTKITYKEGSVGKVALTERPPRSTCLLSIIGGCLTPTLRKGTMGVSPAQGFPRALCLTDSRSWALPTSLPARGPEGRTDGEVKWEEAFAHRL